MAKKILTDIDLSQNELLNAVLQNLSNAPSNPKEGQIYYSTADKIIYQWDGTKWKPVGKVYIQGNGITITGDTIAADFASSSEATTGTSTTKVMSPALVKAVIEALDVTAFAVASVNADGDTITIQGLKETDGKIGTDANNKLTIKIDPRNTYDASDNPLATVRTAKTEAATKTVTVEKLTTAEAGYLSTYVVKQNGSQVGASINIPKDFLVRSGNVIDVVEYEGHYYNAADTSHTTQLDVSSAGKYIDFVINVHSGTATDEHIYLNVADLVDAYTGGAGIEITNDNVVKAKMVTETNGSLASEAPSNTSGRQYPVVPDSNGKLSVNVPWDDTTYTNEKLGQGYATCSTAAATAAKTASLTDYVLVKGGVVAVKFTNAVPASATLNVNSKGAKSIYYKGAAITANIIQAGDTATFMYDGTRYQLLAVDRVNKMAITRVAWTSGSHDIVVTFADGTTSNITIHPTNTAYPETGNGAATPTSDHTPSFGATFDVPQVVTDNFGHVTKQNTRKVTIPSTTATQSAAGLMSAADKKKLDTMTAAAMKQYTRTNPALTATNGVCTWQITDVGDANGSKENAICSLRDNQGNEVFADVQYTQSAIVIKINSAANITAATYTAVIIIPETITVS